MRQLIIVLCAILLLASVSSAQSFTSDFSSPAPAPSAVSVAAPGYLLPSAFASAGTVPGAPSFPSAAFDPPAPASPAPPQGSAVGVFTEYNWQLSLGYTFLRFYEVPGITKNLNGFSYSMQYYFRPWIAADGEFLADFGSQFGTSSHFVFVGGGGRGRWQAPRGIDLWAHALAGYAHLTPQTAFGGQGAPAYIVGGGVDINAHHQRWAYRFQVDMVGTTFFGTYQFSPAATAGLVFKF
jgi:hypothetical protein